MSGTFLSFVQHLCEVPALQGTAIFSASLFLFAMSSNGSNGSNAGQGSVLVDTFNRPVDYARIAVTSQCNLRCSYCMREEHEQNTSTRATLESKEINTIIQVLGALGVTKIRFTGGEPLLCKDIITLVRQAKNTNGIKTVSLTTNGLLLHRFLPDLIKAGLNAVNFSIDTLQRERYHTITRRDEYNRVKQNLDLLLKADAIAVKLNVVLMRDINSNELQQFVELTRDHAVTVRFMELQPFDDNQIWRTGKFFSADTIKELLFTYYPELKTLQGSATQYFSYALPCYKGSIAIIPAFTRNFCSKCNKIRITSDGNIISCLYDKKGLSLLPQLRSHTSDEALVSIFRQAVSLKPEDGWHAARDSVRTSMSEIGG